MVRFAVVLFWVIAVTHTYGQSYETVHIVLGDTVTLRADATSALSYLWFHNGDPINGFHDQRLTVTEAGIYTVMALGENCNSDISDPVEVIMDTRSDPAPVTVDMRIRNEPDRSTVPIGGLFSYQVFILNNSLTIAEDVTVTASIPKNVSYEGVLGNYVGTINYQPAAREVTWLPGDLQPNQTETLTISVQAKNEGKASQIASITARAIDTNPVDNQATGDVEVIALKIPNTFTPNGDGLNDLFEIHGLELFPQNNLIVFNRWGNEVYKASPYKGDWNGGNLAEGTYYYVFEVKLYNNHWQTFKGYITLIRHLNE